MAEILKFTGDQARRFLAQRDSPDILSRRKKLMETLAIQPGERILDVGCGSGRLAAVVADVVGPTGRIEGVDVSEDLLAVARGSSLDQGTNAWTNFTRADAAALPFANASFDVAVSHMVYEYVVPISEALRELRRVLRIGGRVLIVDSDRDSIVWHSSDPERMERVLSAWDEHVADPHLPRGLVSRLEAAGFTVTKVEASAVLEMGADHHLIDIVAAFVAGRRGVTQEEAQAWAEDLHELGRAGRYFYSLGQYWFSAIAPA